MKIDPILLVDGYKTGHKFQYPVGTEVVYSNWTARSAKLFKCENFDGKVVFFGLQGIIKWLLIDSFNEGFFNKPKDEVLAKYKRRMDSYLGEGVVSVDHIGELHDLGYLPIIIKALPEGSRVNIKVPMWTIRNTQAKFFWVTNYLETMLSAEQWKMCTNATIAYEYRKVFTKYAALTGADKEFIDFQGHDFSMRGMSGVHDAMQSGSAFLLSFKGTDSLPALDYVERYYNAIFGSTGFSISATEHSVMSSGGKDNELETYRRLITEVYPNGNVAIVSDTWDFFNVLTNILPALKAEILNRRDKVVVRPDSSDPVKIVVGDDSAPIGSPQYKGAIECLWEVFGGTINNAGYKELDSHIGLIYGDSITLERANNILCGLREKGFASNNICLGVGSYSMNLNSRDTFGHAVKATFVRINGEDKEIFKDPITDNGTKKSAKGLLRVEKEGDDFVLYDQQTWSQEAQGALEVVFVDGLLARDESFETIRNRLLGK